MNNREKGVALRAFRLLLRPLVRILLRSGITWKETADVCKLTFVEVATKEFGLHGRPTNISRVAIMTGIGRREVSRLRRHAVGEPVTDLDSLNSATRVLTGWHLDPAYTAADGAPRELEFDGRGADFSALARKYAPDTPPITMLRELQRVGAVEESGEHRLRVLKRYYMPLAMDPEAVLRAGSMLQDLGNTTYYNLARRDGDPTRFQGRATNQHMRIADAPAFREYLESEGQALLERVDAWLSRHEAPANGRRPHKAVRLGVGVYQIEDDGT